VAGNFSGDARNFSGDARRSEEGKVTGASA
jgi:hypothetical protein